MAMLQIAKAWLAGNTWALYVAAVMVVYGLGFYSGIQVQYTIERARELKKIEQTQEEKKELEDNLDITLDNLQDALDRQKKKSSSIKEGMKNAAKDDPAYKCLVPDAALQLLKQ